MIGWLQTIACYLQKVGLAIAWGITTVLNWLLEAIGFALREALDVFPMMPAFPLPPDNDVLEGINWFFPVGPVLGIVTTAVMIWLAMTAVTIISRWVKAL